MVTTGCAVGQPPEDPALAPRDACPFWDGAGTQAVESALSRGAYVWGHMASSLGASVLCLNTQPPGIAVPAAGQGHRRWDAAHRACAGARCLGTVLVTGADAWVWGSRGRAPLPVAPLAPLKCSQRPALGQVCRLSGQGWGGPSRGAPTCGPQHTAGRRGDDQTKSHPTPIAPIGPLAFPAYNPGCRGGREETA